MVLVKTRGKLLFRMGFIYAAYLISYICRLLMDCNRMIGSTNTPIELDIYRSLKIMNTVASRAKWIFVYYYVIMVRNLKIKLQAEDHQTFDR
jgi:hypothetical protein